MTDYIDLLPVIVERERATLPDGFDSWGIKSVRPDLRTRGGYQWPFPGSVAVAHNVDETNKGACPKREGDGLCAATSWRGMASGHIPAVTLLLVATSAADVLGTDGCQGKSRHRSVAVVALVDGARLLQEAGRGTNLRYANLRYANLTGADLTGADLTDADLTGSDLRGSDLRDATLRYADLTGSDLRYADLRDANLRGATLPESLTASEARTRGAIL